jgi:hypothetical protein
MIKHFKNFFKNPGVQIFLLLAAAPALTATVILPLLTQPNSGLNVLGIVLFLFIIFTITRLVIRLMNKDF